MSLEGKALREREIYDICDSLSIGAAIENMILTATGYGLPILVLPIMS